MQLSKGIYFEFKPASGTTVIGRHAYLVFRDGKGGERVIRGGVPDPDRDGSRLGAATMFVGGNITVQADIPLRESKDKYDVEKGETAATRHARKLDLGGRDPGKVWKDMAAKAGEIGEAGIDYNIIREQDKHNPEKDEVAQTSNSVIRAVLEAGKIDPDKALPPDLDAEEFRGFKNNLAKPQGGFDNTPQDKPGRDEKPRRDGADGAEKPDKKSEPEAPATPDHRSEAATPEGAGRKAARAEAPKDDAAAAEPRAAQTPEERAMMKRLGAEETIGEIIGKDPAGVTRPELDRVIASDAFRTPRHADFKPAKDFVTAWFDNVYRDLPIGTDESIAERRIATRPTPSRTPEGGTVSDAAFEIGNDLRRRSGEGGVKPEIMRLQTALNGLDRNALPLKRDGVFGPKTNRRLRTALATNGGGAVRGAFFKNLA